MRLTTLDPSRTLAVVIPAILKGHAITDELHTLTRDDGMRLQRLLWKLRSEVKQDPNNLIVRLALHQAMSFAGMVDRAREEALEIYQRAMALPAVSANLLISTASIMGADGRFDTAKECLAKAASRKLDQKERAYAIAIGRNLAVHSGDLAWAEAVFGDTLDVVEFIKRRGLAELWPRQQAAAQEAIGEHTAQFGAELVCWDGDERIVLTYFTDLPEDFPDLEEQLLDAIDAVYVEHPEGPWARIGLVVFDVCGPFIPLPAGTQ